MLRVAAAQMNSTPDKDANLAQARGLLDDAVAKGADLLAFPETFNALAERKEDILAAAETLRGPTVDTLREWAIENGIWILGGSLFLKVAGDPDHVTNTSLLIDPAGEIVARYDKIHLFDVDLKGDRSYHESAVIRPGKSVKTVESPWGSIGLSVCYDLRFPELYRKMTAKDDLLALFIPSAFTAFTGKAHWDVLTRARAIENQCYVVAPAQTGSPYPGRETYGHTRIIDPWGRVLAERTGGVGIVWADLDPAQVDRVRAEIPAVKNRRLK